MQILKQKQTTVVKAASGVTIYEYTMNESDINGSTASINGRYPAQGFATNTISKELALVLNGNGVIGIERKEIPIETGDYIHIDANEKFYWEGSLTLFIVCTPAFDPKQHILSS